MRARHVGAMRVLLISGSYPPVKCGVGDYSALLTAALARTGGITVGILTSCVADVAAASPGVEVMPLMETWGFGELSRLLQVVCDWKPDLIHIQYPTRGYGRGKMPLLLPLLLGRRFPVVQTWHEPLSWWRGVRYLPCAIARDTQITVEQNYRPLVPAFIWKMFARKRLMRHIPVGAMIPVAELSPLEREAIRQSFNASGYNLIVYFGFAIPAKGVEDVFAVADPETDRLVLLCDLDPANDYHRSIVELLSNPAWKGKAFATGYLPTQEVARVLAVADAALFPFVDGMTLRNTSVLAAQAQGTLVVTTSRTHHGYVEQENIYFAAPGDLDAMGEAVRRYAGRRVSPGGTADWQEIAAAHVALYTETLTAHYQGS